MPPPDSLPRLDFHKVNDSQKQQTTARKALPNMFGQGTDLSSKKHLIASKTHLPTIPEGEHAPHDSFKAFSFSGSANVPLLPIVNRSSARNTAGLQSERIDIQAAARSQPSDPSSEPGRISVFKPVPHYALPQDRTPLWSERDRPGRFTTPRSPYKQNLDLAPKVKQASNRFSSPAQYGRSPDALPGMYPQHSPRTRSSSQQASQGLDIRHLAPLRPSDLAHANALKQASVQQPYCPPNHSSQMSDLANYVLCLLACRQMHALLVVRHSPYAYLQGHLLASVNDSLEALGLPRGTPQPPLSRGQQWLAAHRLSPSLQAGDSPAPASHQPSSSSTASALPMPYAAADTSLASAVSIEAKQVGADRRSSGASCNLDSLLSDGISSNALPAAAAAQTQQYRQAANVGNSYADLQQLQPSASTSAGGQAAESHNAEHETLSVESLSLSPEPEPLSPEPQRPSPQAWVQSPEHALPVSLSADSFDSEASSTSNHELPASSSASMPAAAEAVTPTAAHALSAVHILQTDTAAARPSSSAPAQRAGLLQDVGQSTAHSAVAVDAVRLAAPASRESSLSPHSRSRSSSSSSSEQSWRAGSSGQKTQTLAAPSSSHHDSSRFLLEAPVRENSAVIGNVQIDAAAADTTEQTTLMTGLESESLEAGIGILEESPASLPAALLENRTDEDRHPAVSSSDSDMSRSLRFHPEMATASESEVGRAHNDTKQQCSWSENAATGKHCFATSLSS